MTNAARVDHLQIGQILHRPLTVRESGHVLLAAGTRLNAPLIDRIQRLGLTAAALQCLAPMTTATAAPQDPEPPADDSASQIQEATAELQEQLQAGPASPETPGAEEWGPLATVRPILEALLERLARTPVDGLPSLPVTQLGDLSWSLNTLLCAVLIGFSAGLEQDELRTLAKAALLHDRGLRSLKRKFEHRNGELLPSEARLIEGHVEYGLSELREQYPAFARRQRPVFHAIRHMTEHWDGSGRPFALADEQIPVVTRILSLARLYASLLIEHEGQQPLLPGDAFEAILEQSGKALDPALVTLFSSVIRPYPVGTLLKLDSGQVAQVLRVGSDPCRPTVQLGFGEGVLDLGQPGAPRILKLYRPRRHPRKALELEVGLKTSGGEPQPARTLDLSLGGARLKTPHAYQVGERVSLTFEQAEVALPAIVAWAVPDTGTLGVRFLPNLPHAARQLLEALTSGQAPQP